MLGNYIFSKLDISDTEVLAIVLTIVFPIIIHSIGESILNIKHSIEKKSKEKNIHIVFETSNQKDFEKFSNSLKSCIFSSAKGNQYVLSSSNSIAFGEDLNKEIKKICKDTDVYIFLFSSSFFENENCLKEMEYIDLYSKDALKIPIVIDTPENISDKLKDTKYLLLTNIESKKDYTQKICQLANYLIKKEA